MARVEISETVLKIGATDNALRAVNGATVQVNDRDGDPAIIYAAETGPATLANPLSSDHGRIAGWLDPGAYDLHVTGPDGETDTTRFEAVSADHWAGVLPFNGNHDYLAGDVIRHLSVLYEANADFTSTSVFDAADWTELTGPQGPDGPAVTDPLHIAGRYAEARAGALRQVEHEDGAKWTETWADRAAWSGNASVGLVSANKLFANPAFAPNVYTLWRALPAVTGKLRIAGQINFVRDTAFFQLKVGVIANAGAISDSALDASALAIGIQNTDGTSALPTQNLGSPAGAGSTSGTLPGAGRLPSGTYQYAIEIDDDTVTLSLTDASGDWVHWISWPISGTRPTHVFLFNSDARGSAGGGSSMGKIVATTGKVTVPGSLVGIENVGPKVIRRNLPTSAGYQAQIALPPGYDSRIPTPVVLYCHGAGSTYIPQEDSTLLPMFGNVMDSGWIFASGMLGSTDSPPVDDDSGFNNWGSPIAIQALLDLYKNVRDRVNLGPILFYAISMGGLVSLSTIARRDMPGIAGWAGVQPVTNLANMYAGGYQSEIKEIYDIAVDGSDYAAKTAGYDPMLRAAAEFRGLPMRFYASPTDAVVSRAQNADLMASKVAAVAKEATVVATSGAHGDASHFTQGVADDITDFFERCLLGSV